LLGLCRGDLSEILEKLRQKLQQDAVMEDQLRAELIDQGRKMNELRADHERAMYEQSQQLTQRSENEVNRIEVEYKRSVQKLKEESLQKDTKIRQYEKNEKKSVAEREKYQNLEEQKYLLEERLKNIQTDRDLID
jgi:hypothetical protein